MIPQKVGERLKGRIEKAVPIPSRTGKYFNEFVSLLDQMELKDSILCEGIEVSRCHYAINSVHKGTTGKRYTGRKLGHKKKRFWRVE